MSNLAMHETEAALEVADIADELVALWQNPKIAGLPRQDRNTAIDGTRAKLVAAVEVWRALKV